MRKNLKKPVIGIINYGMGNLHSVQSAFDKVGYNTKIVNTASMLDSVDAVVLPGVGSFGKGINNLTNSSFIDSLYSNVLVKKKQFLGICLGMQLLASSSNEHGEHKGLDWIPGKVQKITPDDNGFIRLPHVGLNNIDVVSNSNLHKTDDTFYFVHSYHFLPNDKNVVLSTSYYGTDVVASIKKDNITAVQFHPEKSHNNGLNFLSNWCDGIC